MKPLETVPEYLHYMQTHPEITTCPIRRCLGVMGGKWKIFIVLQLFGATALGLGAGPGVEGYHQRHVVRQPAGAGAGRHGGTAAVQ